jgi:hypothetical protein
MQKLTPWFNAKSHPPAREGWYDCKECNARHYFRDGLWYRNTASLKHDGYMTIQEMHWRGLRHEPLASLLARYDPNVPKTAEEQAWENVAAVGMEFGSPDFDAHMEKSGKLPYESDSAVSGRPSIFCTQPK